MWRKKEEKEESLLKKLCGDDAKLYDLLASNLYDDPVAAIPKTDLETLIEEAEKSIKDDNCEEAMQKYRTALDKAIFEATQNPGEGDRPSKVIQNLASKTSKVTEKVKERKEKEGLTDYVARLERNIEHYGLISGRTENLIKVASHFYDEQLKALGEKKTREKRMEKEEKKCEKREKLGVRARIKRMLLSCTLGTQKQIPNFHCLRVK
jgi:vacuolar-type H+-ATPase subunit I/STV1